MINTFKVIVSGFVHDKHGRLLVVRRSADEESYPGMLAIPGGTVEVVASGQLENGVIENTLIREIHEETGVKVKVGNWLTSTCMADSTKPKLYMFFVCSLVDNDNDLVISDETPEVFWAEMSNINLNECTPTLREYLKKH